MSDILHAVVANKCPDCEVALAPLQNGEGDLGCDACGFFVTGQLATAFRAVAKAARLLQQVEFHHGSCPWCHKRGKHEGCEKTKFLEGW